MNWQSIPGNSVSIESVYGPAVAEAKHGDTFVELGVYYGRSLAMLHELAKIAGKNLDIVGVDLFEQAADITRAACISYEPAAFLDCRAYLHLCDASVPLHREDTAEAAQHREDGSVALAFVDGDHSYEGCRRDIAAWWPKIKLGGLLAGHDYSGEYPGVVQAVTEALPEYVHHGGPWGDTGICWYVRKKA